MSPARLHFITEKEGEKKARCPTIIMAGFFFFHNKAFCAENLLLSWTTAI